MNSLSAATNYQPRKKISAAKPISAATALEFLIMRQEADTGAQPVLIFIKKVNYFCTLNSVHSKIGLRGCFPKEDEISRLFCLH